MSWADFFLKTVCRLKAGGIIVNNHTMNAREMRAQVEMLSRHFEFIDHHELFQRQRSGGKRPFCLLTFDDGKRSNATVVADVLSQMGVPAVFYVVTGFLSEATKPLWFDRCAVLNEKVDEIPAMKHEVLKQLPHAIRCERVDRYCGQHGVDANIDSDDVRPMSWDDARRLAQQGHTIGAHSTWHAILPREELQYARQDIQDSMAEVSRQLDSPCRTFAFPNGNYTAELCHHAQRCGAESVMTTEPVWCSRDFPPWRLPRIQLFPTVTTRQLTKLSVAAAGRVLPNPDGTGRLYVRIQRLARAHSRRQSARHVPTAE